MTFAALWETLAPIGRDAGTGGYRRYSLLPAERDCRAWFRAEAAGRRLAVEADGNGNEIAWWRPDGVPPGGVVTGSHLDSVPDGGAYDGPLGVVSALLALDALRERGFTPRRAIGVAVFAEEEGARFGMACLGSRLLTGALAPEVAGRLTDADGITFAEALQGSGCGGDLGPSTLLDDVDAFIELHVEQGRALVDLAAPVGIATAIWPHGRWRFDFTGAANHAGTTLLADRQDPMLTFAEAVLTARTKAALAGALATYGRVSVQPNATNAIAARVQAWLDARAPTAEILTEFVADLTGHARERAARDGTTVQVQPESVTGAVSFAGALTDRVAAALPTAPRLATGAGHDAGVLAAAGIPAAMLFVRNPTGVSHAPGESATDADCAAGVDALATVLAELAR